MEARPFDPARYLDDEESMAEYLTEALETGDPAYVAHALGVVARAKGMTEGRGKPGSRAKACWKRDSNPRP